MGGKRCEHCIAAFGVHRAIGKLFVQLVVQTIERQFEPVRDAKLVVYFAQVVLDDLLGRAQLVGNLLIPLALRDAGDDRNFFRRQTRLALRAG